MIIQTHQEACGSLKRDEVLASNDDLPAAGSKSFKYKAGLVGKTEGFVDGNSFVKNVTLKYLSNFWRSLEMPLINCKVHLQMTWTGNCVLSRAGDSATFKIINANLYLSIVTLSTQDNVKLRRQ